MKYKDFANVQIMEHPLIKHKISLMRKTDTGTYEFRKLVEEVAMLEGYEALRDLPLADVEIETPLEKTMQPMIDGKKLAIVPILRAGLGMVPGVQALTPLAKVGHIGLYRDPVTHEPHDYYCKLPDAIDQRLIVVVDPMLATGGSAIDAISAVKKRGAQQIKLVCLVGAPEGVKAVQAKYPDVDLYLAALDDHLNENGYIVPGLGDAGDRIFGTK